jgi:hypothetical protein
MKNVYLLINVSLALNCTLCTYPKTGGFTLLSYMRNCKVLIYIEHGRDEFCILIAHSAVVLVMIFTNPVPFCTVSTVKIHSILDKHEKNFNQVRSHLCAVHIRILGKDLLATCFMYSNEELHLKVSTVFIEYNNFFPFYTQK